MKSNFLTITIASFFVCLGLIGLVGCNNPPSPSTSPVLLTFKQIEAKVLRGELINDTEIKGLQSEELKRLRNTVFAKYGKVYQRPGLGDYFASCDWYKPNPNYKDSDADKLLTANDNQNVKTIQVQEDSAKLNQSNPTPQIITQPNNTSITNTKSEVQPIEPVKNETLSRPTDNVLSDPEAIRNFIQNMVDEGNTLKVERDYLGRTIETKGEVSTVAQMEDGHPLVLVVPQSEIKIRDDFVARGAIYKVSFYCVFDKSEINKLADIKVGDIVKVRGKVSDYRNMFFHYGVELKESSF